MVDTRLIYQFDSFASAISMPVNVGVGEWFSVRTRIQVFAEDACFESVEYDSAKLGLSGIPLREHHIGEIVEETTWEFLASNPGNCTLRFWATADSRRQLLSLPILIGGRSVNVSGLDYAKVGVDTVGAQSALSALVPSIVDTFRFRPQLGRPILPLGYFANVLSLTPSLGLAISTDGVGTKALVAQELGKFDTIGIDCIAMNVNDVVCVGAEPIAMTDYIAIEALDGEMFKELGEGLCEGARLARISIPGGEVAQIREMIRGTRDGRGFDLVGTCVGLVHPDKILIGERISPGDAVIGLGSTGVHCNGLTLARKSSQEGGYELDDYLPEFERTIAEELLEPTKIYVDFAMELLRSNLDVKALVNITSDGFLNLLRSKARVSYVIDALPDVPPVFDFIQRCGGVPNSEMYSVFNMGIGFCAVVPAESANRTVRLANQLGYKASVIGSVTADPEQYVDIPHRGLRGQGDAFWSV